MEYTFPTILETGNPGKIEEWNSIIGSMQEDAPRIEMPEKPAELIEIQTIDPVKVAVTKAISAMRRRRESVLVEDVSWGLDELGGAPGALYAPIEKAIGINGMLHMANSTLDRRATAITTVAFASIKKPVVHIVKAVIHGVVPAEARGEGGFGFDSIFIPDGYQETYAELTPECKNEVSCRRKAIDMLLRGEWKDYPIDNSPLIGLY